jgi:eukaryotic-like serine/threonine-protein kinase
MAFLPRLSGSDMIAFACTHCGHQASVRDNLAGRMGQCPHCGAAVVFPLPPPGQLEAAARETTAPPARTPPPNHTVAVELDGDPEFEVAPLSEPVADADPLLLLQATELDPAAGPQPAVEGYEILGEIGRGGMGVVYKARQVRLSRVVALKMILAGTHAGAEHLGRFRTEAEAVASLHHPNIVQIYDVGEQEGRPYLALEYLDGGSLDNRLDGTPWSVSRAAALIETLARAVHVAHQAGIVHRDLKPGNVLFTADGTPKITDFGLAKRLDSLTAQTQSGAIMGTPSYMAPEQAAGRVGVVGPHADVYSLGAVLYELLTGRAPFKAESPLDTVLQVMHDEPVRPRRLNPKVPADLETICLKCLDKEPYRRYHSGRALADDLRRFLEGEPVRARPVTTLVRVLHWTRRRPAVAGLIGALAAAFVGLIASGVGWWYNARLQTALDETHQAKRAAELARLAEDEQRHRAEAALANNLYLNRVALAEREWRAGNVARADALLDACAPAGNRLDPRHWEWHYLKRLCHAELQTLKGHGDGVGGVAYSPDGSLLASAGWDQTVGVWETATGRRRHTLRGHTSWVRRVAFGPDGRQLVSCGDDRTLRLWDVATGTPLATWTAHDGQVHGVAWSRDGRRLASAGADQAVKAWDAKTHQLLFTLLGHRGMVEDVAFSPDGERLASAGEDRTVRVWDLATQKERFTIPAHGKPVTCVAFSPDGKRLGSAGLDRMVRLWDAGSGQEVFTLTGHATPVRAVAFSPDGTRLASAGLVVKLWETATGDEVFALRGHTQNILGVAFSPDGTRLATASEDGTLKVWDGRTSPEYRSFAGHRGEVNALAFSPDGQLLASAADDGSVRVWDVPRGAARYTFAKHPKGEATGVAFSPDGTRLAACHNGDLTLWDLRTGEEQFTLQGAGMFAAFSPDGGTLATASYEVTDGAHYVGYVRLWNAVSGAEKHRFESLPDLVSGLAFSPDGARVACTARRRLNTDLVAVWNVAAGRAELFIEVNTQNLHTVTFAGDGQWVVAPSGGYGTPAEVKFWDVASGEEVLSLRGHDGPVFGLALSGDGQRLATVAGDKSLRLWDTTTGAELFSLHGEQDWGAVAFSADGKRLAAAGKDGTIRVWDAARETASGRAP